VIRKKLHTTVAGLLEAKWLREAAEGVHHREQPQPPSKLSRRKRRRQREAAAKYEPDLDAIARWLVSDEDLNVE